MGARGHIGLIGFGTIGRELCRHLAADGFRITVLLREDSATREALMREASPGSPSIAGSLEALIAASPDLVVEAAGQAALAAIAPTLMAAGISVVAASAGALGDGDLLARLTQLAARGSARLIVPAGAIGGLDYLAAVRTAPDARVRYTSRKPLAAWTEELAALALSDDALREEVVLFEGSAAEAARRYPRNLNSGLTVALAAGAARTRVRVVADPAVTLNTHEIEVESILGLASMRFANAPSPLNPKTSALTAASLAAAVRRHFDPVVI